MFNSIKILYHQGKQYIPDVRTSVVPGVYRGRPIISTTTVDETLLVEICPLDAISTNPVQIDLGKCAFCGECAVAFPEKIRFTKDYKLASNDRSRLIVKEGDDFPITMNEQTIRPEIRKYFGGSLKLRQVSAGGDNSCEWEMNAANNVNFDMSRFGIDFVASPRHADGIVITGPITKNMATPLQIAYEAVPEPKMIILAGVDAVSGGIFADTPALDRRFLEKYPVDLYIPGNPIHPLMFINAILDFTRKRR